MTNFTIDEILPKIQVLMDAGEGDLGRLRFILMTLRKGKPLYISDKNYLEKKLNTEFVLVEKHPEVKKPESELLTSIKELIQLGVGDSGRLQFIYETLQKGKTLYKSDKNYLYEKLAYLLTKPIAESKIVEKPTISKPVIESESINALKSELLKANKKITQLEAILEASKSRLEKTNQPEPSIILDTHKPSRGVLPKGWASV